MFFKDNDVSQKLGRFFLIMKKIEAIRRKSPNDFSFMLDQNGPFATNLLPTHEGLMAGGLSSFRGLLSGEGAKIRMMRQELFLFLGVSSFHEVFELQRNGHKKEVVSRQVYLRLGNQYELGSNVELITAKIDDYAKTADSVIDVMRADAFSREDRALGEMRNEVRNETNPVNLVLMAFDSRVSDRARFEALRKVMLMKQVAEIGHRERRLGASIKLRQFDDFLNDWVWKPESLTGEADAAYLLSTHDPQTFRWTGSKIISVDEGTEMQDSLQPGQKLTYMERRIAVVRERNGITREIPVYMTTRKKKRESKVIKQLQLDEADDSVAIDDDFGFMGVCENLRDVQAFQEHLFKKMAERGWFASPQDFQDTLNGGNFSGRSRGSKPRVQMRKFRVHLPDVRLEFILHTHESFLNYYNDRETNHDSYSLDRKYEEGVVELLFPPQIYPGFNLERAQGRRQREIEADIRRGLHFPEPA